MKKKLKPVEEYMLEYLTSDISRCDKKELFEYFCYMYGNGRHDPEALLAGLIDKGLIIERAKNLFWATKKGKNYMKNKEENKKK